MPAKTAVRKTKTVPPKKEKVQKSKKSGVVLYQGDTVYVNCKTSFIGHHFQKYAEPNMPERVVGCVWITLQCVNCSYRKHVLQTRTGVPIRTRRYPPSDFPNVTMEKSDWRAAWYREFYR